MSSHEPDASRVTATESTHAWSDPARKDSGTPMRVLVLDPAGGSRARCAGTDGIPVTVEMALVGRLEPGAIVLVHSGVALARLDAEWVP